MGTSSSDQVPETTKSNPGTHIPAGSKMATNPTLNQLSDTAVEEGFQKVFGKFKRIEDTTPTKEQLHKAAQKANAMQREVMGLPSKGDDELRELLGKYTDKVVKAVNEGYSLAIADADGLLKIIKRRNEAQKIEWQLEAKIEELKLLPQDKIAVTNLKLTSPMLISHWVAGSVINNRIAELQKGNN